MNMMRGLQAGDFRPSNPLDKILADVRETPRLKIIPQIVAARTVIIPDVSFYQDDNTTARKIDFAQMQAADSAGCLMRAGQGNYYDEDFVDFWRDAKAQGIPRGAYWYYDPRVEPRAQALKFAALFVTDPPEMQLTLDAEYPNSWGGSYAGWQHLKTFLDALRLALPGVEIEVYTGYYWWYEHVWTKTTVAEREYFKQFPLHLAWYTQNAADVKIPLPWTQAEMRWWQYTSSGNGPLYGVESLNIDLNYFVPGDQALFEQTYHLGEGVPPMTEAYHEYTATRNRAIRQNYGATSPRIVSYSDFFLSTKAKGGALPEDRHILTGAEAVAMQGLVGDVWVKVYDNNGMAVNGWTALTHKGIPQVTDRLVPGTTPPPVEPSVYMTITATETLSIKQPDGSIKHYTGTYTVQNVEYKPNG